MSMVVGHGNHSGFGWRINAAFRKLLHGRGLAAFSSVVLAAGAVALLPAPAGASTLRCGATITQSVTLTGNLHCTSDTARVDQTTTYSASDTAQSLWVAHAENVNQGAALFKLAYYEQVMLNIYRADPQHFNPQQVSNAMILLKDGIDSQASSFPNGGTDSVPDFFSAVKDAVPLVQLSLDKDSALAPVASLVVDSAKAAYSIFKGEAIADQNAIGAVTATTDLSRDAMLVMPQIPTILDDVWTTAHDDQLSPNYRAFQTAQNEVFAGTTAPIGASANDIFAIDPTIRSLNGIDRLLTATGEIQASQQQLEQVVTDDLGQLHQDNVQTGQQIAQISQQQLATQSGINQILQSVQAWTKNQQDQAATQKAVAVQTAIDNAQISLGQSTLTIVTNLLSLAGPTGAQAAHDISVAGGAVLQIAGATEKFDQTIAQLGQAGADQFASIGEAAMIGQDAAAVSSLVGLFAGTSSPDAAILQEIAQLQQEVKELGQQMNARFNAVDTELSTIYSSMEANFALINTQLGTIQGSVSDIQDTLTHLENQLTEIQSNLFNSQQDSFRRPLLQQIDYALGYQGRTGRPLPYSGSENYLQADSLFYTWATQNAFDAGAVGPSGRSTADQDIANELASFPLDTNVDYLDTLPSAWGLSPLTANPVPNPRDWYLAARAYLDMQTDYPGDAGRNQALQSELSALLSTGQSYQALERAIRGGPYTSTFDGDKLNALFATLLGRYDGFWQIVSTDIGRSETGFAGSHNIDPFGGLNQTLNTQPNPGSPPPGITQYTDVPWCDGNTEANPQPLNLSNGVINVEPNSLQIEQNWDARPGMGGSAKVCATVHWNGDIQVNPPVHGVYQCTQTASIVLTDTWTWKNSSAGQSGDVLSDSSSVATPRVPYAVTLDPKLCPSTPAAVRETYLEEHDFSSAWSTYQFNSPVTVITQSILDAAAVDATSYLQTLQSSEYGRVASDLQGDDAPDVAKLDGAYAAILAYLQVGMPEALNTNEELSLLVQGSSALLHQAGGGQLVDLFSTAPANGTNITSQVNSYETQSVQMLADTLAGQFSDYAAGAPDGSEMVSTTVSRLGAAAQSFTIGQVDLLPADGTHEFGAVRVGTTAAQTITVTNAGLGKAALGMAAVTGQGFSLTASTCGGSLLGGASCKLTITFAPTASTVSTGQLTLGTKTAVKTAKATLTGRGVLSGTPGAPQKPSVASGDGTATVTWKPPTTTGSGPVTGYTVSVLPSGPSVNVGTKAKTATLTGLTNGDDYLIVVSASNAAGQGADSKSVTVTPYAAPQAPTSVVAIAADSSAVVSWVRPPGGGLVGFKVAASPGGQVVSAPANKTSATVTGLTDGTAYTFTVTARNGAGSGPASAPSNSVTPAGVPQAPTNVTASPIPQDGVSVTWTAPANGGSNLTAYTVDAVSPTSTRVLAQTTVNAPATSTTFQRLQPGTALQVTVSASNSFGQGPASAPTQTLVTDDLPAAPRSVSASAGDGVAEIIWAPPTLIAGNTPVDHYTVSASPGGAQMTVDGNTTYARFTGLTNDTRYTFTVTATTAVGTGPSASAHATPNAGVPSAPTNVQASAVNGGAAVTWTAATDGPAPASYTVARIDTGGGAPAQTLSVPASQTKAMITGLSNGHTFEFVVAAVGSTGSSEYSSPSAAVESVTPPSAPQTVQASAGDGVAAVSWSPGSGAGQQAAPTGYTVTASPGGASVSVGPNTLYARLPGLTDGTSYQLTVTPQSTVGNGAASSPVSVTPSTLLASAPTITYAQAGDATIQLSWSVPTAAHTITQYRITAQGAGHGVTMQVPPQTTTTTIPGLNDGVAYTVTVSAITSDGTGLAAVPPSPLTPIAVPGAPTNLTVQAGDQQITAIWDPPTSGTVDHYTVTASPGGQTASVPAPTTHATLTGLTDGTAYHISVVSVSAGGTSQPVTSPTVTPAAAPDPPTGVTATAEDSSAVVKWTAPTATGGDPISAFLVTAQGSDGKTIGPQSFAASASSGTVTGLTNGKAYVFTVTAKSAAGTGLPSDPSVVTIPDTAPAAPGAITATPGDGAEALRWTPPSATPGNTPILGYLITAVPDHLTDITAGPTPYDYFPGLVNGVSYTFYIEALSGIGAGDTQTTTSAVAPTAGLASPPVVVEATPADSSATVTWDLPINVSGGITQQTVYAWPASGSPPMPMTVSATAHQAVFNGLTDGTAYTFTVRASTSAGLGPESAPSDPVTPTAGAARRSGG